MVHAQALQIRVVGIIMTRSAAKAVAAHGRKVIVMNWVVGTIGMKQTAGLILHRTASGALKEAAVIVRKTQQAAGT